LNRLGALHDAGVSIWLDTLSRELLESGAFAALIADFAVTGATSNPTIFAKAITGSDRYDDQLFAAVASGTRDTRELFFALALDDVRRAADLLRPVHEATDGRDGFVSFECTPDLADDTLATVDQALGLWDRLARRNGVRGLLVQKTRLSAGGVGRVQRVTATAGARSFEPYSFAGADRRGTLLWLAAAFAVLVIVPTRWRGLLALCGFAASVLLIVKFLVPAILAGSPALLVAVVGALAVGSSPSG
jgi:hypothetical protein